MQNDLLEIFERLESLKVKAQSLGEERERLEATIAEAEARVDEARRLVESAEKRLGHRQSDAQVTSRGKDQLTR